MENKYLTVTALTKYLKYKIESDDNLKRVYLKGEISNFKAHSSGHFYFSVKDEKSIIRAIMFSSQAKKLGFIPNEGMKVLITGSISLYEASGNYQIYVDDLLEDGLGNLYIAFEKLKEKLTKEGLFDSKYKKDIPKIPEKVGIITAQTGAAIKDILSTIKRRFPYTETYLLPCLVQGDSAYLDIIKKIKQANEYDFDLIILGRGGGSFEDMNCFNHEEVARAIFASKIPIISAVGHEVDFTIADFVADLRAPTPTGAAELAVPNKSDLIKQINQYKIRLSEATYKNLNYRKLVLDSLKNSFVIKNPMLMYNSKKQTLDLKREKLNNIIKEKISLYKKQTDRFKEHYLLNNPSILYQNHRINLNHIIERLELLNPMSILKRGYTITYKNDTLIKSVKQLNKKDKLTIKLIDGNIDVVIDNIGG